MVVNERNLPEIEYEVGCRCQRKFGDSLQLFGPRSDDAAFELECNRVIRSGDWGYLQHE